MPINGKVAKILDKHTLVANIGESDGVESGMQFLIYEPGETIRDPDTGDILGNAPDIRKAEVEVDEIMDNMSVMKSKTETYTVSKDPTNFQVPNLFGEKTVVEQEELKTDEEVPEDRTKISKGDSIRQISADDGSNDSAEDEEGSN